MLREGQEPGAESYPSSWGNDLTSRVPAALYPSSLVAVTGSLNSPAIIKPIGLTGPDLPYLSPSPTPIGHGHRGSIYTQARVFSSCVSCVAGVPLSSTVLELFGFPGLNLDLTYYLMITELSIAPSFDTTPSLVDQFKSCGTAPSQ